MRWLPSRCLFKFLVRYLGQRSAPYFSSDPKPNMSRKTLASKVDLQQSNAGNQPNYQPLTNRGNIAVNHGSPHASSGGPPTTLASINLPPMCPLHHGEFHPLERCEAFLELEVRERIQVVSKSRLCYICFQEHFAHQCTSGATCNECSRKHHTLIHTNIPPPGIAGRGRKSPQRF